MSNVDAILAETRENLGRGASRAERRLGQVPGIVYGAGKEPTSVVVDRRVLDRELVRGGFYTRLYHLKLEGKSEQVLPREVQLHPVTDVPLHVDFLRLAADTTIRIQIPVQFVNETESQGLKRGGVLNIVRHEVEVNCRADAIPESLQADVSGRDIGDAIRISDINLPAGVEPVITDRDFTIATITASSAAIEEAADLEGEDEMGGDGMESGGSSANKSSKDGDEG